MTRRIDHIAAIRGPEVQPRVEAIAAYDRLLNYFDEYEPEVASAIRCGLVPTVTNVDDKRIEVLASWRPGSVAYTIPENNSDEGSADG